MVFSFVLFRQLPKKYICFKIFILQNMKEQILLWLKGPRVYLDGVKLYETYGYNRSLKQNLSKNSGEYYERILIHELAKLAGISEQELKNLERTNSQISANISIQNSDDVPVTPQYVDDLMMQLAKSFNTNVDDFFTGDVPTDATEPQSKAFEALKAGYLEVPETMKKIIRFREEFPFLSASDCPDELKILVSDMFTAYDKYRAAFKDLSIANSPDDNFVLAQQVIENYLENRSIWEELEYYKEHGEVLGQHPLFSKLMLEKEISAIEDVDLIKKLTNARSNVTKNKSRVETSETEEDKQKAQEALNKWSLTVELLTAEIEKRKKK